MLKLTNQQVDAIVAELSLKRNKEYNKKLEAAKKDKAVIAKAKEVAKMVKEYFLMQSAYHEIDVYCSIQKTAKMLRSMLKFNVKTRAAIEEGVSLVDILDLPVKAGLSRLKIIPPEASRSSLMKAGRINLKSSLTWPTIMWNL